MVVRGDEGEVIRLFTLDVDEADYWRLVSRGPFVETGDGLRVDWPLRDLIGGIYLDEDFVDTNPDADLGDPAAPGWQDGPFLRRADPEDTRVLRDALLRERQPYLGIHSAAFGIDRGGALDDPIHLRLTPPLRLIGAIRLRPAVVAPPATASQPAATISTAMPATAPRPESPPQRQRGTQGRNVVLALVLGVLVALLFLAMGGGEI